MKNILFGLFLVFSLCGFTSLAEKMSTLIIEAKNTKWDISTSGGAIIKAFHEESQTELIINLGNLLPSSTYCLSNKRIKDIEFTIAVHKVAKEGESEWEKAFNRTEVKLSGKGGSKELKVQYYNLLKNNHKADAGVINVGTLTYISPFTCKDIDGMNIRIKGMKNSFLQPLPPVEFKIKLPENK